MKLNYYLLLLIAFPLFYGCSEEETNFNTSFSLEDFKGNLITGASVKIYSSIEDLYSLQNHIYEFETDGDRFQIIPNNIGGIDRSEYLFYSEVGDLNTNRWTQDVILNHFEDHMAYIRNKQGEYHVFQYILGATPTKLSIMVSHDGVPVENARVQLYYSEEGYLNNLDVDDDLNFDKYVSYGNNGFPHTSKSTDQEGLVFFDKLEPRKYWFKIISDDELSNDGGTISLDTALPDDPNITTSITVGIN